MFNAICPLETIPWHFFETKIKGFHTISVSQEHITSIRYKNASEPVVCVLTTAETEDSAHNLCPFSIQTEYRIEIIFIVGKSNRLTLAMYSY